MAYPRLVADWLAGWNAKDLALAMRHFAEDAVFSSPSVLALGADPSGRLRGGPRSRP
jgi:ketosteroid isomerase-like protein